MVMTILEARVSQENWDALEKTYLEAARHLPPGLVEKFLAHSSDEPDLWRIMSVWTNHEALEYYRSSGEMPRGVLIFRSVQVEPVLSIFDLTRHITFGD